MDNMHDTSATGPLDFETFSNIIDGKTSSTTKTRHGINPSTGKPLLPVPVSTPEDVERAMTAGLKAVKPWARTPYARRREAVLAFADALEKEEDAFARMLTLEQGKPLAFAHFEMQYTVKIIRTMASLELPVEEVINEEDRKVIVRYSPLGLVVGISPWNYPVLLCCSKIAPCVVTGNPIIVKPSPFTPYGVLKAVELAQRFFPPGVVQALSGDDDLGPWLTAHPAPSKVTFTGSTATGKRVMESCSKTLKRVTLELGGNDPAIVLDDVNIDEVAPKIASLAFLNSGQICLSIKRIYVHEKIFERFRDRLIEYTKTLRVGDGFDKDVFVGPVQNSMQYERVKGFFDDIDEGKYDVAVGGTISEGPGYFINPTIIDRPKEDARIVVEEPFGPIAPLLTFGTDEEAIEKANDSQYGLGASVWSADVERAARVAQELEAGIVWVNAHFELDPRAPAGGFKQSGIGVEFGVAGLKSYCNSQTIYLKK